MIKFKQVSYALFKTHMLSFMSALFNAFFIACSMRTSPVKSQTRAFCYRKFLPITRTRGLAGSGADFILEQLGCSRKDYRLRFFTPASLSSQMRPSKMDSVSSSSCSVLPASMPLPLSCLLTSVCKNLS